MNNTDEKHLIGVRSTIRPEDNAGEIAWDYSKIAFIKKYCEGKSVLDLGCVQHDPDFANNKYWVHKAVKAVAEDVIGLDLYKDGVDSLNAKGYNIVHGDAQNFDFKRSFEVIVAGDLIEHLSNFAGFLESSAKHMTAESHLIVCTPNPWHWHKVVKALKGPVPVNEEHTCWLCPQTLRQLAARFGLKVVDVEYGSMRAKDSFLPLPKRLRHASWYSALKLA